MEITVRIDEDVWRAAQKLAQQEGRTAEAVVTDLMRRGLASRSSEEEDAPDPDLPVLTAPEGAPTLTSEMVRRAMEED